MLPTTATPILKAAIASQTAQEFMKYAPAALEYLKTSTPKEWTESDMKLANQFYAKAIELTSQTGTVIANNAVRFQELSHNQIIDIFNKLDLDKLDAAGTAKVADTAIKETHKTSRLNTAVTALGVTISALAAFSTAINSSNNHYNRTRPRSLLERIIGDNPKNNK